MSTRTARERRVPPAEQPRDGDVPLSRRPEIDLLRVVAMLCVFVVHAAEPFNPWDEWHVRSPERSKWLGELVLFLAPWVMPLFILLAGMSAWHSLGKRTARAYLHERVTRLIIPLAAGILLLVPPQVYLDRRQRGLFEGSFVAFYPRFFDGVYPNGNFAWLHLWFLGILAALALVTLPLFRWLRGAAGRRAMARISTVCARPGGILLLALPIIAVRMALWATFPHARPIVADWSNRTTLLAVFVTGYLLGGAPRLMESVDRQWKGALGVALAFSAGMFVWAWPGNVTERFEVPFTARYVSFWSAYTVGAWAWSVALLGAARTVRRSPRRLLDLGGRVLNPFYMLHQTVVVMLAFPLVALGVGPGLTFAGLSLGAFATTIGLCALAERTRLTRFLFGMHARAVPLRRRSRPGGPRGWRHAHDVGTPA